MTVISESLHPVTRVNDNRLLGVRIGAKTLPELVFSVQTAITNRQETFIFACANPHSLVVARKDVEFRQALETATSVVADGIGCQWAAALAGVDVGPRITGSAFFASIMATLNQTGGKAFFFGSSEEVLEKLILRVNRDFPRVAVRSLSPPFRPWSDEENSRMIEAIREFDPDSLWVGMTAPKQEKWVARNAARLEVPAIASIGAVFDYYAGVTQRAPQWICDLGLEWLYRLPREPRRLWKRTVVSAPLFLWYVILERLRR
jgi:N-acetylglucosaminyldiphosphoundecaprenol N-acetyl-beta-D-mannosaminyltransferase